MPHSPDDRSARLSVLTAARRTAALINVLADESTSPDTVVEVLREHGESGPLDISDRDLRQMRDAAAALREIFAARDVDEASNALNHLLRDHTGPLRLTSHGGGTAWHPHLDRDDDGPWDEWLLASSGMALTVLIWDRQRPPGGICASPTCQNVFLTSGSGPEQRYCSRRCATRERVAAHRRSHAS